MTCRRPDLFDDDDDGPGIIADVVIAAAIAVAFNLYLMMDTTAIDRWFTGAF